MRKEFTASAERAISKAGEIAAKLGTRSIGTEHLLYGLAAVTGTASRIMRENDMKKMDILIVLEDMSPQGYRRDSLPVSGREARNEET